jgi:hypothetical protein
VNNIVLDALWKRPALWEGARGAIGAVGYDTTDWMRTAMYKAAFASIGRLRPEQLDVLEISGGNQWTRAFKFRRHKGRQLGQQELCARQFQAVATARLLWVAEERAGLPGHGVGFREEIVRDAIGGRRMGK